MGWLGREEGEDWQDLGDRSPLSHPWGWSCAEYSSAYLWGTVCVTLLPPGVSRAGLGRGT